MEAETDIEEVSQEDTGVTTEVKTTLTSEEFNSKFKLDEEENQYPEDLFKLSDGSIVNADYFSYGVSNIFDYATAIFYKGKLAHLQLDTEKSIEEIESELGIEFDAAIVNENKFGYEIIFDEKFVDDNVSVYPFEWKK